MTRARTHTHATTTHKSQISSFFSHSLTLLLQGLLGNVILTSTNLSLILYPPGVTNCTHTHVYTIYIAHTEDTHTRARTHFHKQTLYFGAEAKTNTLDLKLDHNTHKQSSVVATVLYFYFPFPYQTHAVGKHQSAGEQRDAETNAACLCECAVAALIL